MPLLTDALTTAEQAQILMMRNRIKMATPENAADEVVYRELLRLLGQVLKLGSAGEELTRDLYQSAQE